MNFQSTQINYKQNYPYVLSGESNLFPVASTGMKDNVELYPAVCQQPNIDNQYKLQNVGMLPELQCPNASKGPATYSSISTETCQMAADNKWWYTNPNQLYFPKTESEKCIPQFQNSIETCSPRDCMQSNPNAAFLQGFECNKVWNNHTKRRFIDGHKRK